MFIPRRRVGILQRERERERECSGRRSRQDEQTRARAHLLLRAPAAAAPDRPTERARERASEAMFWWGLKLAMSDATSTRRKPLIYYSGIVLPWQDFRTDSEYLAPKIQIRACVLYFLCVCLFVVTRARARARRAWG